MFWKYLKKELCVLTSFTSLKNPWHFFLITKYVAYFLNNLVSLVNIIQFLVITQYRVEFSTEIIKRNWNKVEIEFYAI